jgi:hypothetical protein
MQVKVMEALSLNGYAIIAWHFASGTWRLKGILADGAALLILNVPFPSGNSIPGVNFDLHCLIFFKIEY